ncbi:hypothetical protein SISNIDRAFT_472105 [Sistotremastrum niveocremeum HHB9708]|uniref:Uncharacterized protein n=1 Tax=Sistotremastrum niveocremeum HHB9708 TaxID=1314777 RepID=A0A165AIS7_9AGAM|nr:hypothetical protein SISNIDRAFT_472105 [Sistotremastrum niveocremeum HHB9708]
MSAAETVIREVTRNVWTFSTPFARFGFFPIGGRSTAIKLRDGDIWVFASTPLNEPTKSKLDSIGAVKYLVAPDGVHHLYINQFKEAYPNAKVLGVEPLVEKKKKEGLIFDGVYGVDSANTKYGYFSGHQNKDVAFMHNESKSLIVADLLFNLPPTEQYSQSSSSASLPFVGSLGPFGSVHKRLVSLVASDKAAMKKEATTVANWDFDRIIPCHGDVIETDGNKAWREAYKAFID